MSDENNQDKKELAGDEDLDKIMQEIANEEAVLEGASSVNEIQEAHVQPISSKMGNRKKSVATEEKQSLTLELTGSINLKLNFASGDRSIEVQCLEDMLVCRMADGTEFRVPIGQPASAKKSA